MNHQILMSNYLTVPRPSYMPNYEGKNCNLENVDTTFFVMYKVKIYMIIFLYKA